MPGRVRLHSRFDGAKPAQIAELMTGGYIRFYSGVRPERVEDPVGVLHAERDSHYLRYDCSDNLLLATLKFSIFPWVNTVTGEIVFSPTIPGASEVASGDIVESGVVTFARIYASDNKTALADVSVAEEGADICIETTFLPRGSRVAIRSFVCHTKAN